MKKILLLLFVSVNVFGQSVDYNKIILPEHVQSPDFAEKLVQLAWKNHPTNEIYRRSISVAEYEVKKGAAEWLDIISLSGNLNEFNINPERDINERSQFFPRYNVGARIPLGLFLRVPYQTKQNRQRVVMAESQLDAQKLEIRNIVMKTYNDYLFREKVYKIQTQLLSDMESSHKSAEQKFKNGEITFEMYATTQANYNRSSIVLLEAERDYKNTKLDLEKLIGLRLEDVR